MRLLDVETLEMHQFFDKNVPDYAILSHTWGADEVLFSDMSTSGIPNLVRRKQGYAKINFTCYQAKKDAIQYVWIDTCCIDKSSSAELSEAINSMFKWYQNAEACYAYIEDVSKESMQSTDVDLAESRWFTRGWTLQELLAPAQVYFFDQNWQSLGTKRSLDQQLSVITGIETRVLWDPSLLYGYSIAVRMSWAAKRETTRIEDTAYALLGIFDVNMPLLYGEGGKAFFRLQEEIVRSKHDHSLLAWNIERNLTSIAVETHTSSRHAALATSPKVFINGKSIVAFLTDKYVELQQMTPQGLAITLPLLLGAQESLSRLHYVAVLDCHYEDDFSGCIGIPLVKNRKSTIYERQLDRPLRLVSHHERKNATESRIIIGHDEFVEQLMHLSIICWVKSAAATQHGFLLTETSFYNQDRRRQVIWNNATRILKFPASDLNDAQYAAFLFRRGALGSGFIVFVAFWKDLDKCWISWRPESTRDILSHCHKYFIGAFRLRGKVSAPKRKLVVPLDELGLNLSYPISLKVELKEEYVLSRSIFILEVMVGPVEDLLRDDNEPPSTGQELVVSGRGLTLPKGGRSGK